MAVTIGELEARLHADVASFVAGMRQASGAFTATAKTIQQGSASMNSLQSAINGVQNGLGALNGKLNKTLGIIGAGFIMPKIFMAAKSAVIDFNQQVDQATVALTNFLGSGSEAKKMIGELQDFAARTPFQFQDLLGTTQSMMAMGVAADEVLPRMQAIGDAAAAMGGSPEVLYRIQRALGQIQAKGRVQSEELLQLAEAGIPAYQYMADALGTTTADMLNDMRKGTVDSATAITAILDGMSRDFGGMMEEQSKTMMGAMSTVMDYVQITVGAIFRPFFETLRDAFVAIANLLSSEDMKNAASNFAKSVASVIQGIKTLITAFAGNLKKPFMQLIKAIGDFGKAALRIIGAMKPMLTAIVIPLALGFIAIAKAVVPVVSSLASLAEVLTRNQVVMYALAALLTAKLVTGFGASGKAAGAFTNAIAKGMSMMGQAGKDASIYFRVLRAEGKGAFEAIKVASQTAGLSVKAFGTAMLTAMAQLLPLMLAFMALGKAMEAFSNRNRDAKERTSELTTALREQTDAILASENALISLGTQGLNPLQEALTKTGKEGEETTNALISLGKSGDDYLQTMRDFKNNTEDAAYAIALQKGFTEEQAKQMAQYVKTADKGKDSTHKNAMAMRGFTPEMVEATMALEQLDDASENTNFVAMTKEIINATIRSNEATQKFYEQAKAQIAAAKAAGTKMTADEEAVKVYEVFIGLSKKYQEEQNKINAANEQVAESTTTVYERMSELIANMKDGKVEVEALLRALMGLTKYAQVSTEQAFFQMGVALNDFSDALKGTNKNQNALTSVGYDFLNMVGQNQATILSMGGTLGDVDAAMKQMVETFIKQGQSAGYSKDEMVKVLQTMGLLEQNGDIVLTLDVETERLEKALKILSGMGGADALAYSKVLAQLSALNEQKKRSLNLDLKAIDLGKGLAGSNKKTAMTLKELRDAIREVYAEGLANARNRIAEAKQDQEDYAKSIKDSITSLVSFNDILGEQKSATDALTQAKKAEADADGEVVKLRKEQMRLIAKYQRATSRDEQLSIQDEMARNTEALTTAENKLAEAKQNTTDAEKEQNKVGKTFMEGLRKRVQAAKDFAGQIQKLRELGLGETALQQIISAGAEVGGEMAKELIDGAAAGIDSIGETNKLLGELDALGSQVGKDAALTYYNAGVLYAQSIYDGLKAQWEKLKPELEKMTGGQLAEVYKNVQTSVPAYVDQAQPTPSIMNPAPVPVTAPAPTPVFSRQYWRDKFLAIVNKEMGTKYKLVNDYIKGGATAKQDLARQKRWDDYVKANNVPALASGGIVNSATLALIGEKGPEAVVPLDRLANGGGDIYLTVHAGMGTNGQQVGQQIVNELIAWQRRNGSLPVRVQG